MKHFARIVFLSVFVLLSFFEGSAQEQKLNAGFVRLSFGPDVTLPVGGFSDAYQWGIGGSVQADFAVLPQVLYLTANVGFQNIFNDQVKSASDLRVLPVKGGVKYFPIRMLYVQGEAGASLITNKTQLGGVKSAAFVYAPQVGVYVPLGGNNALDAGFRYERMSKLASGQDNPAYFGLRVAYSFSL